MTSPRSRLRPLVRLSVLTAAVTAFFAVGASPALAQHVSCGQVITHNTHVKNDLLNCPGDGLVIGASNIKLNLGGHTIDGVNSANDGINNKGGFDNVKVEHGTIQQFRIGIELNGADGNKLEHLTVTQNPFDGIRLTGSNNNAISHVDESASFDGIFLVNSDHNVVSHSQANSNGSSGIVLQFLNDFNTVDHNVAHDNGAWGLTSDGSTHETYTHNKLSKNGVAGLEPFNGDNSVLKNNKLRSNTLDGIHTGAGSSGDLLIKNHSNKNGHDGIHVDNAGNTLTKNHADKNVNLGVFAVAGNFDGGGNKAHKNGNSLQ